MLNQCMIGNLTRIEQLIRGTVTSTDPELKELRAKAKAEFDEVLRNG